MIQQHPTELDDLWREGAALLHRRREPAKVRHALRRNHPMLGEMTPHRIDGLRLLSNQEIMVEFTPHPGEEMPPRRKLGRRLDTRRGRCGLTAHKGEEHE